MSRERALPERWEAYLGPVAMAQFIEVGWIKEWPKTLTAHGQEAVQRHGYGVWNGTEQRLPKETTPSRHGAAHWPGRTTNG